MPEEAGKGGEEGSREPAGEEHELVVHSLLDLQRRLRGESASDVETWSGRPSRRKRRAGTAVKDAGTGQERVAVTAPGGDLQVTVGPEHATAASEAAMAKAAAEKAAAPARAGAMTKSASAKPSPRARVTSLTERIARLEAELDDVLGSIGDIKDAVAREEAGGRLQEALGRHREGLAEALDDHFARLERTITKTFRSPPAGPKA